MPSATLTSVVLLSALLLESTTANDLPNYFPTCHLNEDGLNDCILNGFKTLKSYVGHGIEEIGLPSLKPLYVARLEIGQEEALANYSMILNNFTVWGLDNYDVKEFRYDPNTTTFHGRLEYDKVIMSTVPYNISGQILLAPLKGEGFGQAIIGPLSGSFEVNGNIKEKDGIDYYNTTNIHVHLDIADGYYFLSNIFDNPYLTRTTVEIFNINSKLMTSVVTPVFEEMTKLGITSIMESLTNALSYEQMFPIINSLSVLP
ncbi:hypothetical protein ILUMI_19867 [Ignelater luminosus]|uniref:Uncharacterized protein n=1 Tax=Ignelater luminosus TaxID=2038154 RepID=A0A8K0CKU4_IGNLU|nr:hypothetical protein ILUMI_19867 [Ignelater luminosus]